MQQPSRQPMKIPAQRIWHRLRFIESVQAAQRLPAVVAAQFDHPRAKHHAELHPAQQPVGDRQRRGMLGAQENRIKTSFRQHRFPAEGIKRLARMEKRKLDGPKHEPNQRRKPSRVAVGQTRQNHARKNDAHPRRRAERGIARRPEKDAGSGAERNSFQVKSRRQQSVLAQQRNPLIYRYQKRNQVHQPEAPLEHQPRQPIAFAAL